MKFPLSMELTPHSVSRQMKISCHSSSKISMVASKVHSHWNPKLGFKLVRVIKFPLKHSEMEYLFMYLFQTKFTLSTCLIENQQRDWFESVLCTNVCCAEKIWFNCKLSAPFADILRIVLWQPGFMIDCQRRCVSLLNIIYQPPTFPAASECVHT